MNIKEEERWFGGQIRSLLTADARWRRKLHIVLVLGGAFLSGCSGILLSLDAGEPFSAVPGVIGLLMTLGGGTLFAVVDEGAPEALAKGQAALGEARENEEKLGRLANEFRRLAVLYSVSIAFQEAVHDRLTLGPGPENDELGFEHMLDILLEQRSSLLGIGDERWNLAVYLPVSSRTRLDCVACRYSNRADELRPHRSWNSGESHVGRAFALGEEQVTEDVKNPNVTPLMMSSPDKRRPDDLDRYRSVAAVPIRTKSGSSLGVVVATSDVAGRFRPVPEDRPDAVEPLRLLAAQLALWLSVRHLSSRQDRSGET